MGEITIGGEPIESWSDERLYSWMQEKKGGYALRPTTAALWVAIMRSLDKIGTPMTVRGLFYQLASVWNLIPKTEQGYVTAAKQILSMRRAGVLPYSFIADNTRWVRRPDTYSGLSAYFEHGRRAYRRAIWDNQRDYVEIWCEKDAVAGLISDVTNEWDVPLMVIRGYSSETFAYNAAEAIKAQGKPAYVYYFGDHDRSGVQIAKDIERKLKRFGAQVNFERVAILEWQIEAYNLPTRPGKDDGFGDCVEIDALPANLFRQMVKHCILRHIDQAAYDAAIETERLERETLETIANNWGLDHKC